MSVSFVSSGQNGALSGTAITCTVPSFVIGDLALCLIHLNDINTISDNNGANPLTDGPMGRRAFNTASAAYYVQYRFMTGAEAASFAWTGTQSERWQVIISMYRSVAPSVWDVAPAIGTESLDGSNDRTHGGITTLTPGAMLVAFGCGDSSSQTFTVTPADSFTNRQNATGKQLTELCDKATTAPATQGSVFWTSSVDGSEFALQMFALKAATSGVDFGENARRMAPLLVR